MKTLSYKHLAAVAVLAASPLQADENLWMYAKGTDTRPQGSFELKLQNITRYDKGSGNYMFNDFRPEIEYGITDKWTIGAAILLFDHDYSGVENRDPVEGSSSKSQYAGFEIETKYNILSPYKDAIGLSVGLGFEHRDAYRLDGAAIDQDSFVPAIYLQKNYLDDRLVFAFTGKMELERRKSPSDTKVDGVLEEEIAFDLALGVSYRVAPKWFVGLEARYQSDFLAVEEDGILEDAGRSSWDAGDLRLGDQFQYGTYIGPSVHYAEEGWWVTASALYLVKSGGDESRNGALAESGSAYDEHERWHFGVTVGFEF